VGRTDYEYNRTEKLDRVLEKRGSKFTREEEDAVKQIGKMGQVTRRKRDKGVQGQDLSKRTFGSTRSDATKFGEEKKTLREKRKWGRGRKSRGKLKLGVGPSWRRNLAGRGGKERLVNHSCLQTVFQGERLASPRKII